MIFLNPRWWFFSSIKTSIDLSLNFMESTSYTVSVAVGFTVPVSGVATVATDLLGLDPILLGVTIGESVAVSSLVSLIKLEIVFSFENSEKSQKSSITTLANSTIVCFLMLKHNRPISGITRKNISTTFWIKFTPSGHDH